MTEYRRAYPGPGEECDALQCDNRTIATAPTFKGGTTTTSGQCFSNAAEWVDRVAGREYVQGYAVRELVGGELVYYCHAWGEGPDGRWDGTEHSHIKEYFEAIRLRQPAAAHRIPVSPDDPEHKDAFAREKARAVHYCKGGSEEESCPSPPTGG
jgi:hypothetical protein